MVKELKSPNCGAPASCGTVKPERGYLLLVHICKRCGCVETAGKLFEAAIEEIEAEERENND